MMSLSDEHSRISATFLSLVSENHTVHDSQGRRHPRPDTVSGFLVQLTIRPGLLLSFPSLALLVPALCLQTLRKAGMVGAHGPRGFLAGSWGPLRIGVALGLSTLACFTSITYSGGRWMVKTSPPSFYEPLLDEVKVLALAVLAVLLI